MPKEAGTFEIEVSKRNVSQVTAVKRILTCTLNDIRKKVVEKFMRSISIGTISIYKPFFITFAPEREMILCMCILSLNIREVFDSLTTYFEAISAEFFTSVSQYMMENCDCDLAENGYWEKDCCLGICDACKDTSLPMLPENVEQERLIKFIKFETVNQGYFSIKLQKMKKTKRVERVEIWETVSYLYDHLKSSKIGYTYHRFQAENDKHVWLKILLTIKGNSPIFHMDYSENLQLTPKFEPQSAHFNKCQSTLHCTVAHTLEDGFQTNKYIYHLSDDNKHDAGFTFTVIKDLLKFYPDSDVHRFKSDKCSIQVFVRISSV